MDSITGFSVGLLMMAAALAFVHYQGLQWMFGPGDPPTSRALEALGFDLRGTTWTGVVDGIVVRVKRPLLAHDPWQVVATLPFEVPPEFRIRRESMGWHASPDAAPLAEPAMRQLKQVVDTHDAIVERAVTFSGTGEDFEDFEQAVVERIGLAVGVAVQLRRSFEGVSRGPDDITVEGPLVALVDQSRWRTTLRTAFAPSLPPDTRLEAATRHPKGAPVGDLLLDAALDIASSNPEVVRQRLARDEIRGPLLDLLCRFPGSALTSREIIHVVTGPDAFDVDDAVARLRELQQLLAPSVTSARTER